MLSALGSSWLGVVSGWEGSKGSEKVLPEFAHQTANSQAPLLSSRALRLAEVGELVGEEDARLAVVALPQPPQVRHRKALAR